MIAQVSGDNASLTFLFSMWQGDVGLLVLFITEFKERGVSQVTIGITGLWLPSVHSIVAFWSFNVDSSYHSEAKI